MPIDRIMTIRIPPEVTDVWLNGSRYSAWVGALSAEDRCTASILALKEKNLHVSDGYIIDYGAELGHKTATSRSLDNQWEMLLHAGRDVFKKEVQIEPMSPYAFQEFQAFLEGVLLKSKIDFVLFDITCMTKIHLLALAATLAKTPLTPRWSVVYAKPENYIALEHNPGWKDILIAPLGDTGFLLNEAFSRGIVIPGHEGDRLIVALSEMEASGGIILIADTKGRPDLRSITKNRNRRTIQWLTNTRTGGWTSHVLREDAYSDIAQYVSKEVKIAKQYEAPIVLFPYGPKSLVFTVAKYLGMEYPERSWFVYPIPLAHAAEFSEGTERLIWILPSNERLVSNKG